MAQVATNKFEALCTVCRHRIAPEAGIRFSPRPGEPFTYYCAEHADRVPKAPPMDPTPDTGEEQRPVGDPAPVDLKALQAAIDTIVRKTAEHFVTHVPGMVKAEMLSLTRTVEIKVGKAPAVKLEQSHYMLPVILQAMIAGASPFLVGPAGSGKTTLAEQTAAVLKLKFYMAARVTSEFKLVGFRTATGETVRTQFREAYEHGGVFLFDEADASDPDALTAFNAALANGWGDFPDGMVKRHKDFYAIAAGNTYGRGADRQYVGRNQLDAATLDRFQVFDIDYDELLEVALAGDKDWTAYVQRVRKAVELEKVRHIVSPRASIRGARMLAAGMERKVVENACIWKGLPADQRQRVETRMISC